MADMFVNPPDLDRFVEARARRLDEAGRTWARRHLRRFLMRDPRCRTRRRPRPGGGDGDGDGEARLLEKARRLNLSPVWFVAPPEVDDEVGRVLDWIGSLPEIDARLAGKLERIPYEHARGHADRWHQRLTRTRRTAVADDPGGTEPVLDLGRGWRWVRLTTPRALDYEGRRMRNCVGDGSYDRFCTEIYSLRDSANQPHCTVEHDPERDRIQQARARANQDIPPRHGDRVAALLELLRPKRLNARLTEFAVAEDGAILRVSRAADWPRDTRILNHLVLSNRDDVEALPDGLHVNGSLILANCGLRRLPRDLTVCQALAGLALSPVTALPEGLTVRVLNLEDSMVKSIAPGTRVLKELNLVHSPVRALPAGLKVGKLLILDGTVIHEVPPDLVVAGRRVRDMVGPRLPETTVVIGDAAAADFMFDSRDSITVFGRLRFTRWPQLEIPGSMVVHGDLELSEVGLAPGALRARVVVHGDATLHDTGLDAVPESWTVHGRVVCD